MTSGGYKISLSFNFVLLSEEMSWNLHIITILKYKRKDHERYKKFKRNFFQSKL